MEIPEDVRRLLESAGSCDDEAAEIISAVADDEPVSAIRGLAMQLRAVKLTLEAAVLATLQPPHVHAGDVPEVQPGWYRVELMGHRRRHGHLDVVRVAGRQLVELRCPAASVDTEGWATGEVYDVVERYAAAAIFSLRESSEDDAREEALGAARRRQAGTELSHEFGGDDRDLF